MSYLNDGFSTIITFGSTPGVRFKEQETQPPGITGGGANNITTMRNTAWRTKAPKRLKELMEGNLTVLYDPVVLSDILAALQVNQQITLTFPDTHTWTFWGWLEEFVAAPLKEGDPPTAAVKIVPSLVNGSGVETAPVYA